MLPPILYEDEALIFVDKPPGIVVQRGYDPDEPVLFETVSAHLEAQGERAFLVQRLDRGTSGVMFFTKLETVNRTVTRFFEQKRIAKTYLAVCEGDLAHPQTIDAPLARVGPISFGVRPDGRRCVTHLRPLAHSPSGSLLEIRLETGRTHQIRAHLAAIGHPLAGDWLYGLRNASRPMLHAASLAMPHPLTGVTLLVESPLPADFLKEMEARRLSPGDMPLGPSRNEDRADPEEVNRLT